MHCDEDIAVKKTTKSEQRIFPSPEIERSLSEERSSDKSTDRYHLDEIGPFLYAMNIFSETDVDSLDLNKREQIISMAGQLLKE